MTRDDILGIIAILLVGAYAGVVAVCACRSSVRRLPDRRSDQQARNSRDPNAALGLLGAYHREYQSYHARKENMAWLVGTLGVAAAVTVFAAKDLLAELKAWPDVAFWPFFLLCIATAVAILRLLRFQNVNRRSGAAMFEAAANTYVHWVSLGSEIPAADLTPTRRPDHPWHQVPAAVADRYAEILGCSKPSREERLGYVVVGAWGAAALLRIVWARFGG